MAAMGAGSTNAAPMVKMSLAKNRASEAAGTGPGLFAPNLLAKAASLATHEAELIVVVPRSVGSALRLS